MDKRLLFECVRIGGWIALISLFVCFIAIAGTAIFTNQPILKTFYDGITYTLLMPAITGLATSTVLYISKKCESSK